MASPAPGVRRSRAEDAARLLDFLRTIQKPDSPIEGVDESASLIDAGLIDSLAILEIVAYLERTYGIDFAETGVDPGDLTSIAGILDLIERL